MSRSTWACELKSPIYWQFNYTWLVTLHVSVWVEIFGIYISLSKNSSRSTWACELKFADHFIGNFIQSHAPRERVSWNRTVRRHTYVVLRVTLHVSVWVEIWDLTICSHFPQSRSTWACELKWNFVSSAFHKKSSRSTWACELKLNRSHTFRRVDVSRSTWACELKFRRLDILTSDERHAPRERVSWNSVVAVGLYVTPRHAPRERVSWNYNYSNPLNYGYRHAPRERVSWNVFNIRCDCCNYTSRSTWACELKSKLTSKEMATR